MPRVNLAEQLTVVMNSRNQEGFGARIIGQLEKMKARVKGRSRKVLAADGHG